jgi:hypothetical protein
MIFAPSVSKPVTTKINLPNRLPQANGKAAVAPRGRHGGGKPRDEDGGDGGVTGIRAEGDGTSGRLGM